MTYGTVFCRRESCGFIRFVILMTINAVHSGHTTKKISDEALKLLMDYSWPGNVRELGNVIERALILCETNIIIPRNLPQSIFQKIDTSLIEVENEILSLKEIERKYIQKILKFTGNNKLKAAKLLGIDPKTLYRKLQINNT